MVTALDIILTCIICVMAVILWMMRSSGSHNEQRNANENEPLHSHEISTVKPLVKREPWMKKSETAVSDLNKQLQNIPENMRIFSAAMRSLYAENQVSAKAKAAGEFLSLRDDTKRDALVYVNGILPFSQKLVRSISEFFDLYEAFEDLGIWKNNLPRVIDEVKGYRQCCEEVIRLHKDIMAPLKEKQDRAKLMLKKMGNLSKEYEEKMEELEQKAIQRKEMGITFAEIPVLNVFVTPFLFFGANLATAEAVATKLQLSINETATLAVGKTMVPALASFIEGLEAVAGFFAVMENELTTFHERGEKVSADAMELHFMIMKSKAKEIKDSCRYFFAVVPAVTSDFSCIPATTSDKNYVDEWLEEQHEKIKKKYRHNITKNLKLMITYLAAPSEEHQWNA